MTCLDCESTIHPVLDRVWHLRALAVYQCPCCGGLATLGTGALAELLERAGTKG